MVPIGKSIAMSGLCALVLSVAAASVVTVSATPAFAERGGNGNGNGGGNGNGNSNRDKARNDNARGGNGNGRGQLSRELRGLNAAHANQNALMNASPNSMPGKLYVYQQAHQEFVDVVAVQDDAYDEYERLTTLTEEEIDAEFPDGGYEDAVTAAAIAYEDARTDAVEAQTAARESLIVLTDGAELSDAALAELNRLLGL